MDYMTTEMTEKPMNLRDIDSKLRVLSDIMTDMLANSPTTLISFLKDYSHLFNNEDSDTVNSSYKVVNASSQTDNFIGTNPWNLDSITEDVTHIAEKVTLETGYTYDENTGWYYDQKMNCYYNANYRLYYYAEHKAYYYYDEESKGLKFYCSAPQNEHLNVTCSPEPNSQAAYLDERIEKQLSFGLPEVFKKKRLNGLKEEGECSNSGDEEHINEIPKPIVIEARPTVFEPDNTKHFAPCIRIIVKSSTLSSLCSGTLFIVTCTGGTIGREGDHDVLIPDHLVSKIHSKFQYVYKDGLYNYELIDLGSKNGTFVNGRRLSDALVQSEPTTITHGSIITVGHTDLLCHIHPYDDTCSDCAPLNTNNKDNDNRLENDVSLKDKFNIEASFIRKKFGINNCWNTKYPIGYEDRAEIRRKHVGSSHSSEKTETASINEPICKNNKGYTLLSKMGWKEGETLGKRNEGATLEPIQPTERSQKKRGLGCDMFLTDIGISKKNSIATKTAERFKQMM